MMDTTAVHFDTGFGLNKFAWITAIWEVSVGHNDDLTYWLEEIENRWPGTKVVTEGEFGLEWRKSYQDNSKIDYRFIERGNRRSRIRRKPTDSLVHEQGFSSGVVARCERKRPGRGHRPYRRPNELMAIPPLSSSGFLPSHNCEADHDHEAPGKDGIDDPL